MGLCTLQESALNINSRTENAHLEGKDIVCQMGFRLSFSHYAEPKMI